MSEKSKYVSTKLSLSDKDNIIVSDVYRQILEDEINELPKIKEGQINVSGVYIYDQGDKIEVKMYARNGTSRSILLGNIPLVIENSKGEVLARKTFDLRNIGEIPSYSARPAKIYFERENFSPEDMEKDKWRLALEGEFKITTRVVTTYEGLPDGIEENHKKVYQDFLDGLPDLQEGQFSVSTFSIGIQTDGNILVSSVMRNGANKPLDIAKFPLTLMDEKGEKVLSAEFVLKDFRINPYKARICNFIFPTKLKPDFDHELEGWSVQWQ